jgi:DedD protein
MSRARVALVSDVLDLLLAEAGTAPRSVLFQAAMHACAEESKRVKQGHHPVPLEALVKRAREILASPAGVAGSRASDPPSPRLEAAPQPEPYPEDPFRTAPVHPSEAFTTLFADDPPPAGEPDPSRRPSSPLLLAAVLGPVVLAGVVLFLYLRPRLAPPEVASGVPAAPSPTPIATPAPPASAAPPAPRPAARPTAVLAPPPALHPGEAPAGGIADWAESMTSPDWAGRSPTFVIHFSSYRERAKAERDAAALARRYGRPAYAAEVTLPNGTWYRVVLGNFPTAEAARAFREALAAAHTSDLAGVYRITPP